MLNMRILFLDVETSPNIATIWGVWQQNVAANQLQQTSQVLCWAASWYGEPDIYFDSVNQSSRKSMLKAIHKMMDEADVIVHYNGTKFDIPTLQREFLLNGLPPVSPYKQVDLLKTVRSQFRFAHNKLDFVVKQLGMEGKTNHTGHQLWLDCMAKDPEAWKLMEEYNVNDVVILEELYEKLKGWIKNPPNQSVYSGEEVCPSCGGNHYQKRGLYVARGSKYQRYRCSDCSQWFHSTKSVPLTRGAFAVAN